MSNSFGCMYLFIELICMFQTSKDISVNANDLFFISKLKYDKFYYCWYIKGCKTPYSHAANRNTVKSGSNNSIFDTMRFVYPCEAELIWKCPKKCPTSVLTQVIKANLPLSYPTTYRSRNSQCIILKKGNRPRLTVRWRFVPRGLVWLVMKSRVELQFAGGDGWWEAAC